jgi:hypothetical protein
MPQPISIDCQPWRPPFVFGDAYQIASHRPAPAFFQRSLDRNVSSLAGIAASFPSSSTAPPEKAPPCRKTSVGYERVKEARIADPENLVKSVSSENETH